jgi:hypothetical protein
MAEVLVVEGIDGPAVDALAAVPGSRAVAHAAGQGDAVELDDDLVRLLDGLAVDVGAEPPASR